MSDEKSMLVFSEEGLIVLIKKYRPDLKNNIITVTERCLTRDGGIMIYFESSSKQSPSAGGVK
jgi:hypothetical protein